MARWLPLLVALAGLAFLSQALGGSRATVRAEDNLLSNGGFERGVEGWGFSAGSLVADAQHPRSGGYAGAFTHSSSSAFFFQTVSDISPLNTYTLQSFCIKNDPGLGRVTLEIAWYASADGTGSALKRNPAHLTVDDPAFQLLKVGPVTPPPAARSARVRLLTETTGAPATVYCDDFSLTTQGPMPTSTPTPTFTSTPVPSATPTASATATPTPSSSPTATETAIASATATETKTPAATPIPVASATDTPAATQTPAVSPSVVPTSTQTPTQTPSPTSTTAPTATPTYTPTSIPTALPIGQAGLVNPGFEQGDGDAAPGWQAINGTLRRTTGEAYTGDYAGRFTFAGPGQHSFYQTVQVVAEQRYQFSGSCKSASPSLASLRLLLGWYATSDGTGTETSSSTSPSIALPAASYQLLSTASLTPPKAARSLRGYVQAVGDGGEVVVYCDEFSLQTALVEPSVTPTATESATPSASASATATAAGTGTPAPTSIPITSATPTATLTPLPTSAPIPPPTSIPTALVNPGFEQGDGDEALGWQAINGILKRRAGESSAGSFASQFTFDGPGQHSFYQTVRVVSDQRYQFSGSCKSASPSLASLRLLLGWYATPDGTGPDIDLPASPYLALPAASYQLLSTASLTPPKAARSLRGYVQTVGDGGEVVVYCDEFSLETVLVEPSATSTATLTPTRTPPPSSGGGGWAAAPTSTPIATRTVSATPSPTSSATLTATVTSTPTPFPLGVVLISEVLFNPKAPGRDTAEEWVELENRGSAWADIRGWTLSDNFETDPLPGFVIHPGGYALLVARPQVLSRLPTGQAGLPTGPAHRTGRQAGLNQQDTVIVVIQDGSLGNGLANAGDRILLRDGSGQVIDALSWGSDASVNNPACPAAPPGHSLQRGPRDTGSGCPFQDNPFPSPGLPNQLLLPTPTATATATATPSPTPTLSTTPTPSATPTTESTPLPTLTSTPVAAAIQEGTPLPPVLASATAFPLAREESFERPAGGASLEEGTQALDGQPEASLAGQGQKQPSPEVLAPRPGANGPRLDNQRATEYASQQEQIFPTATTSASGAVAGWGLVGFVVVALVTTATLSWRVRARYLRRFRRVRENGDDAQAQ